MKKFLVGFTAIAMALAFTVPAQAATVADLQAMIASLQAQLSALNSSSTTTTTSGGYTFNANLTIGSKGADVTALQNMLISKGFSIPAGATGYFGAQTKAAVIAWQTSAGITPAAGYFGPISRANANAAGGSSSTTTTTTGSTVPGCAAGAMFSATTGAACTTTSTVAGCAAGALFSATTGASCTTTTTTSTTGSITTPGKEGILTISAGPISNSVVNVGATNVPILTIRAQAQNSDIALQRVQLDLGTNTKIYTKIYSSLSLVDAATGAVIATTPLNSSTVVQSGSNYIVSMTGFNSVVPMGTYHDFYVTANLFPAIDTTNLISYTVSIDANGVRGIDGAGQDQYGPASAVSQAITVNASLVDNSIANIALDPSTPQANSIPVTDTTNGQYLKLPVLVFSLGAQNDTIHIHNFAVNFSAVQSAAKGSITAAYLYQGSTQVSSAAITLVGGNEYTATFSNITDGTAGASVPVNTTLPYTVKVDVTGVTTGNLAVTASTTQTGTTIYNSQDGNVATTNGTAGGNTQTVLGIGPVYTLNSATISQSGSNQSGSTNSTSTITATFSVSVQAVGTSVYYGTQASTTNPMFTFDVYNAAGTKITGTVGGAGFVTATSSGFMVPSGTGFITAGTNSFYLPQQQTGTLSNITYSFAGKDSTGAILAGGPFSVGISQIQSSNDNGATYTPQIYMAGLTSWRTAGIMP